MHFLIWKKLNRKIFSTPTPPTYFLVPLASFNIIFVTLNIHRHPMLPKKIKFVQLGALGVSNVPFQCPTILSPFCYSWKAFLWPCDYFIVFHHLQCPLGVVLPLTLSLIQWSSNQNAPPNQIFVRDALSRDVW